MIVTVPGWVRSTAVDDDDDPRAYVRIAVEIRDRIESGDIAAGDPVPSITTLVQEHGVARQTAAKALQLLEREGLARRVPGLGYFVTRR